MRCGIHRYWRLRRLLACHFFVRQGESKCHLGSLQKTVKRVNRGAKAPRKILWSPREGFLSSRHCVCLSVHVPLLLTSALHHHVTLVTVLRWDSPLSSSLRHLINDVSAHSTPGHKTNRLDSDWSTRQKRYKNKNITIITSKESRVDH